MDTNILKLIFSKCIHNFMIKIIPLDCSWCQLSVDISYAKYEKLLGQQERYLSKKNIAQPIMIVNNKIIRHNNESQS